jgi:hypothetical protein
MVCSTKAGKKAKSVVAGKKAKSVVAGKLIHGMRHHP